MAEEFVSDLGEEIPEAGPVNPDELKDMIETQSKSKAKEFIQFSDVVNPGEGKNKLFLVCEHCKCRVIRPGYATLVEKELFMPSMTEKNKIDGGPVGDNVNTFWLVEDMFHFENVGFSKTVNDCEQYLVCADCEIGPIGWTSIGNKKELYVAADRVRYANS